MALETQDATAVIASPPPAPPPEPRRRDLRIAIVADSASAKFGGEAIHPIHYFRILRSRGIETWLVVHSRTRQELTELFPDDLDHIEFVEESLPQRILWQVQRPLPRMISYFTLQLIARLHTQYRQRKVLRRLVDEHDVNIIHHPIPLSPKDPSMFYNIGAPVVVGPLNGGMTYPRAFRGRQHLLEAAFMRVGRAFSNAGNWLFPGKRRAATILIANERTRRFLPSRLQGKVVTLIDNCVDLATWKPSPRAERKDGPVTFVYLGRLVGWKAVDLLLEAFAPVARNANVRLEIIGDGVLRSQLEQQARDLGIAAQVNFQGWKTQRECADQLARADVLVLPSLYECGGAVVLEGMAVGLPVIATDWGGPADYVVPSTGILVHPASREAFVSGLTDAMSRLAGDADLRASMGAAARQRVVDHFDWQRKVDLTLDIFEETLRRTRNRFSGVVPQPHQTP